MEIRHSGLYVFMAETVSDIRDRKTGAEHIYGTRMTETVCRIELFETFCRQSQGEIFFADSIYSMPCQFFATLINKKTISEKGFWRDTVAFDVTNDEISCLFPKFDLTKAISFTEDGQGFVLRNEVVEGEGGYFRGPGARVVE